MSSLYEYLLYSLLYYVHTALRTTIVSQSNAFTASISRHVTLPCVVNHGKDVAIMAQWIRNGTEVKTGTRFLQRNKIITRNYEQHTDMSLVIDDLQPDDGGSYECRVTSVAGSPTINFTLQIMDVRNDDVTARVSSPAYTFTSDINSEAETAEVQISTKTAFTRFSSSSLPPASATAFHSDQNATSAVDLGSTTASNISGSTFVKIVTKKNGGISTADLNYHSTASATQLSRISRTLVVQTMENTKTVMPDPKTTAVMAEPKTTAVMPDPKSTVMPDPKTTALTTLLNTPEPVKLPPSDQEKSSAKKISLNESTTHLNATEDIPTVSSTTEKVDVITEGFSSTMVATRPTSTRLTTGTNIKKSIINLSTSMDSILISSDTSSGSGGSSSVPYSITRLPYSITRLFGNNIGGNASTILSTMSDPLLNKHIDVQSRKKDFTKTWWFAVIVAVSFLVILLVIVVTIASNNQQTITKLSQKGNSRNSGCAGSDGDTDEGFSTFQVLQSLKKHKSKSTDCLHTNNSDNSRLPPRPSPASVTYIDEIGKDDLILAFSHSTIPTSDESSNSSLKPIDSSSRDSESGLENTHNEKVELRTFHNHYVNDPVRQSWEISKANCHKGQGHSNQMHGNTDRETDRIPSYTLALRNSYKYVQMKNNQNPPADTSLPGFSSFV